jgi:acetyl-CoA carboxylase biotin carboxyl carrier protein
MGARRSSIFYMNIKLQDIESLIEIFDSSDWDEMHLKCWDIELFLSTDPNARSTRIAPAAALAEPAAISDAGGASALPGAAPAAASSNWVPLKAPNLGTFYRAPKPGAPSFVEIGQQVEPDTEVCLIEVMKLFTSLKAGVRGVVRRVCVEDAAMVEFGDTLFYIEPA